MAAPNIEEWIGTKDRTIYLYYNWNPCHLSLDGNYKTVKEVAKATPAPKGLKWLAPHVLSAPDKHKEMLVALCELRAGLPLLRDMHQGSTTNLNTWPKWWKSASSTLLSWFINGNGIRSF